MAFFLALLLRVRHLTSVVFLDGPRFDGRNQRDLRSKVHLALLLLELWLLLDLLLLHLLLLNLLLLHLLHLLLLQLGLLLQLRLLHLLKLLLLLLLELLLLELLLLRHLLHLDVVLEVKVLRLPLHEHLVVHWRGQYDAVH